MHTHNNQQENTSRSAAAAARSGTTIWNDSSSDAATAQLVGMEEEGPTQAKFHSAPVQRVGMEEEEPMQGKFDGSPIQRAEEAAQAPRPNNTGLPDNLKSGIENLSGYSMDDVKVHYNSAKPAQLSAHAYAQGTDIHVAPGQERHLPHEAWHVVQQKQGRVKPTMQVPSTQFKSSVPVNDDAGLEKEAEVMGMKAMKVSENKRGRGLNEQSGFPNEKTVQRLLTLHHGGSQEFISSKTLGNDPFEVKGSAGELGSKGMYYWKDDVGAALLSAITYNPNKKWAVLEVETELIANAKDISLISFLDFTSPPKVKDAGKEPLPANIYTIGGINYRYIQKRRKDPLGENRDGYTGKSFVEQKNECGVTGELPGAYSDKTGESLLDQFDYASSPTSAKNFTVYDLKQVRLNDNGLKSLAYAQGAKKNIIHKGEVLDEQTQQNLANTKWSDRPGLKGTLETLKGQGKVNFE